MDEWYTYLDKRVKIVFDDGGERVSIKVGKLTGFNNTHLFLLTNDNKEAVNISKVIRVEEMN